MQFSKVYLFNDTIENNILFGKPHATQEEVVEAAKQACCHDFIMSLPQGYQTVVNEKEIIFQVVKNNASLLPEPF